MNTNPERRPMPATERDLARALMGCTMLPGSAEKRFVRQMAAAETITQKQVMYLYAIAYRYRKQLRAGRLATDLWRAIASGEINRWSEIEPESKMTDAAGGTAGDVACA